MLIFARHQFVAAADDTDEPALLLEGHWPAGDERFSARQSLDESIDSRHAWIDVAASELTERVTGSSAFSYELPAGDRLSLAYINALALRYYFVRLLRPIAYFMDQLPGQSVGRVAVHLGRHTHDDYADVIPQLCRQAGLICDLHWHEQPSAAPVSPPANGLLRRAASWLNRNATRLVREHPHVSDGQLTRRILLCGNPRVLNPLCGELLGRGCQVAWLYDRFAFGACARWWARGVQQLTCDSACGQSNRFRPSLGEPLLHCGVELAPSIHGWLQHTCQHFGAAQSRLIDQVTRHLATWQPDAIVLDEDATPLPRIAVWAARRQGVRSLVVQHGAPRVRFGFAPLTADQFLAWGESSASQLAAWGVPRERIIVTGSTSAASVKTRRTNSRSCPTILLFATTLPSDARPDAVEYHLTSQTHDEMLRMALAAVAGLPRARLVIKLHPRCRTSDRVKKLLAEFPGLNCRLVRRGKPGPLLQQADVVLNCGSSAGIEAAHQGLSVIELLPAGSHDLTPAAAWGLFGSATSFEQLCTLLDRALRGDSRHSARTDVFAATGRQAARALADAVLQSRPANSRSSSAATASAI